MCTGIEIGLIVGTVISAAGATYSGVQQHKAADAQAEASEAQAKINAQQADAAQQAGEVEARKRQKLMAQDIGKGLVGFAGNGVSLDNGSSVENFLESTTFEAEQDVSLERHNARLNSWGYQNNASMNMFSAGQQRKQGNAAMTGSVLGATGTLVSGVSGAYSSYDTRMSLASAKK